MEPGEPADAGRGPRKGGFADLRQRTLTALAMSVVAIAAVGVGDWAFAPLAALIAAGMGWELRRMTAGEFDLAGWLMGAAGVWLGRTEGEAAAQIQSRIPTHRLRTNSGAFAG